MYPIKYTRFNRRHIYEFQHNATTEVKAVRKNLENSESELEKVEEECGKLKLSVDAEHQANTSLREVITKLEKELGEEKHHSLNVQKTLSRYVLI